MTNTTRVPLFQVDAFTERPFGGNAAAVCVLQEPLAEATMQAIAAEMDLSETAIVRPLEARDGRAPSYELRWFTPQVEVALCGHATLATAAVLFQEMGLQAERVEFHTRSGILAATRRDTAIGLDFPVDAPAPCEPPPGAISALGSPTVLATLRSPRLGMTLVHLESAEIVAALTPDMHSLAATGTAAEGMGYIVTAAGWGSVDFVSRFFAPALGIDEDPVTGSSHTVLTPYWSRLLDKPSMHALQVSARGGELWVEMLPNDRVGIVGNAVVVFSGELRLDA